MVTFVKLPRILKDPKDVDNPVLAFFLAYWNRKRGLHRMPSRMDIRPQDMAKYLGWIVMVDAFPDFSDFRYRLIGSRIDAYFLKNATGHTITEAFSGGDEALVKHVLWIFQQTCKGGVPLRMTGPGAEVEGRLHPDYDALYLPLSSDGEVANMVLNVFTFNYDVFVQTGSASVLQH